MLMQQVQRVKAIWGRLSQNQKVAVMFVGMAAVIAVGMLLLWRPPKNYDVAFSNLSSDDAAAIVDQLNGQSIPYELSADGTTIKVPSSEVANVRLSAASNGLPKGGGVGFELFDKSSFGITEFAQQVNYQRALEGELQRTINKIDSVASSRVHIVIPQETLFTEDQQPTTAAVVVQFKPGGALSAAQIKGVTHLVASSVPGLVPQNLTVVDTDGDPIWSGEDEANSMASAGDTFTMQKKYESDLARQLGSMVDQVVGPGHAAVRVNAVLNWDERTIDSETYSPDGQQGQIRSQQETTQTSTGSTTGASGVPGTDSNTGTDTQTFQEGDNATSGTQSESKDVTTNYELSKRTEHVVQAPGQVERLSVAVVLNQKQVDPVVTQQIQGVIAAAAGIDANRGDTISVSAVPFSDAQVADTSSGGSTLLDRALDILKIVGMIAVPLVAIFFARRTLLQGKPQDLHPALTRPFSGPDPSQMTNRISMTEVPTTPPMPMHAVRPQSSAQQQVAALAESDPAQLAALVRMWMNEDK
jgi:flagellar M-ring protein FliF